MGRIFMVEHNKATISERYSLWIEPTQTADGTPESDGNLFESIGKEEGELLETKGGNHANPKKQKPLIEAEPENGGPLTVPEPYA